MIFVILGAHNYGWVTPILSLGHSIFTDWFIFRLLFPAKMLICSYIRFFFMLLMTVWNNAYLIYLIIVGLKEKLKEK